MILRGFDSLLIWRDAGTEGGSYGELLPTAHRNIHVADGRTSGGTLLVQPQLGSLAYVVNHLFSEKRINLLESLEFLKVQPFKNVEANIALKLLDLINPSLYFYPKVQNTLINQKCLRKGAEPGLQ